MAEVGYVTPAAAAERLQISEAAVRKRIRAGKLPAEKEDGRWWISTRALDDIVAVTEPRETGHGTSRNRLRDVPEPVTEPDVTPGDRSRNQTEPSYEARILQVKLDSEQTAHQTTQKQLDDALLEIEEGKADAESRVGRAESEVEHLRGLTTQQAETIQNLSEEMKGLTIALHHEQNQRLALEAHVKDESEDEKEKKRGFLRRAFTRKPKRKRHKFARVGPS